jgi:3-oxoacyl-[acyl-carrier-protein] synthase-3
VPHQANLRIIRATQERLGIDDSKIMVNIDRCWKPIRRIVFKVIPSEVVAFQRLKKGDLVLLAAVGAGYTTGGMLLRWAY